MMPNRSSFPETSRTNSRRRRCPTAARGMVFVLMIARQNFSGGPDLRGDFQSLAVDAVRDLAAP